ncbi:3-oxoacyl-[acyl-carrier-protein] synthase 3 [Enhygromyxa salina]|uniref:Beta-ketoacyl-[acyl-carrier-protein] synthase III n=1 Tax=Enhygromyxa salina TaxID=215803 RepID=A0A2S9Y7I4_9BACT|nr:beta-ketoacyl-ACP synthase III [Enhygromyxa salina]PRQ01065.1 3-oxoacyl-[acyl-carrier-protein] synthase 3 [Enhygromyxa salina]
MKRFKILGTGMAVPERVLTNHDLEQMVDTSDAWITERTGIKQRHIADAETSSATLGARALRSACEQAELETSELDVIVVATSSADTVFPSTGCWIQNELGIRGMPAFDIAAGCTGFLYALEVAACMLAAGSGKRIGVVGCEVMSKVVDWTDRTTCVLFGDGSGAMVIESCEEDTGLLASNWGADGGLAPILYLPAGGTRMPATAQTVAEGMHTVKMTGNAVFRHAVRAMTAAGKAALKDSGLEADDIDLLIPHQANMRIMEACRSRLKIPVEKMFSIVDRYGNMSAATIPVAIHEAREAGRMGPGTTVALAAFGTGLTWGGAVLQT